LKKNQLQVVVRAVRQLTPRIREYVLGRSDGAPLPAYEAGAHIELYFSVYGEPVVRHYSLVGGVASQPDDPGVYRIAVQHSGRPRGSAFMHEHFALGSTLCISRPKNNFALNSFAPGRQGGKTLLVAAGIGITPIVTMLRSLVHLQRDFEVLYVGRSEVEMAYLQDVQHLANLAGKKLHVHFSRQQNSRFDVHSLLAAQPATPVPTCVYVCGPASLVQSMRAAAAALEWEAGRVVSELFTPAPTGDETPFELHLEKSGLTLKVGQHTSILEAMAAAGLQPLFDCRRGECGVCPLPVLAFDDVLQHRDAYLSDEEKASGNTMCICVSRIRGSRLVLNA